MRIGRDGGVAGPTGAGTGVPGRIAGLDLARGLAVLGMFGAHLWVGGEPLGWAPSAWGGLVDGRPSILFATLAGVSIALLSGRTRPLAGQALVGARVRILVRAAWVFLIGGLLELLDTYIAIILGVYAALFVLAVPFLRWSPGRLLLLAGAIALAGPPLVVRIGQTATADGTGQDPFTTLFVTGHYPAAIWWAFVLVGLAVGRLDLTAGRVRAGLVVAGAGAAALGYAGGWWSAGAALSGEEPVGLAGGIAAPPGTWDTAWFSGAAPHSGTPFEVVGSTGVAVAVIGLCLLVADRLPRVTYPVASVGALALSVYTAHILVLEAMSPVLGGVDLWLTFILVAAGAATAWRLVLGRGPLERLLTWSSSRAAGGRDPVGAVAVAGSPQPDLRPSP